LGFIYSSIDFFIYFADKKKAIASPVAMAFD